MISTCVFTVLKNGFFLVLAARELGDSPFL
jgi:hypothetical protein